MKASIVYWYGRDELRRDGGGLRVLAWDEALTALGFDVEIVPLWTTGGATTTSGRLSRIKRAVVPMPFSRKLPASALDSELVVSTVPATFADALDRVADDRLVLDWMDLWSVNAATIAKASRLTWPGGLVQSTIWKRRERAWISRAPAQSFAGHADVVGASGPRSRPARWLPTPTPFRGAPPRPATLRRVGFIGNLDYPPNELSLREFVDRHAHRLVAAGLEIVVAGYGSDRVRGWDAPVTVLGEVDCVETFYAAIDAAVVPVNHGGGIKVKAVEALSFGLPTFVTSHVREGFSPDFHEWLLPVDAILETDLSAVARVDRARFESTFSQAAFSQTVAELVGSLGARR